MDLWHTCATSLVARVPICPNTIDCKTKYTILKIKRNFFNRNLDTSRKKLLYLNFYICRASLTRFLLIGNLQEAWQANCDIPLQSYRK